MRRPGLPAGFHFTLDLTIRASVPARRHQPSQPGAVYRLLAPRRHAVLNALPHADQAGVITPSFGTAVIDS